MSNRSLIMAAFGTIAYDAPNRSLPSLRDIRREQESQRRRAAFAPYALAALLRGTATRKAQRKQEVKS